MREEALRIEQVTLFENEIPVLDNITLNLFEGEILGLICVNFRGQDALLRLIEQNVPIHYGFVYLHEQLVNAYGSSDRTYNKAAVIEQTSRLVEDLSVADNIFVLRHGFKKKIINRSVLEAQVEQLSKELGVPLDPRCSVGELSFYGRCVVALFKAYVSGSKLVVLRNISNFMSAADLKSFHRLMHQFTQNGVSFLYVCNHHEEVFEICDRAVLMEDGTIKKYLDPADMTDQMISYYSEPFTKRLSSEEKKLTSAETDECSRRKNDVLIFRDVYADRCNGVSFSLAEGECAVLLDTDAAILNEMIELLRCGRKIQSGKILIDGRPVSAKSPLSLIGENPAQSMIMNGLSAMDNLCFQLDVKQRNIWRNTRAQKSVMKEFYPIFGETIYTPDAGSLPVRARLDLVYYRILLRRPKVVVCVQPFSQADMYLRSHIISLINKFKKQNTAFLILAVSPSDSLYVADRLMIAEKGRIIGSYSRSEFHSILPKYHIVTK